MFINKKISVIIPCKNEEAALYSMLKNVPSVVDEVIVIDNESKDNTALVAKKMGARVIKEKKAIDGVGYGFAHQTGMRYAKGDIIVALDGDNTYPMEKIPDILLYMQKTRVDFVSCARFPLLNMKAISKLRQLGIKILNIEASILFRYPVKDILSGMWAMNSDCVKKLSANSGEWNFSPEIKLKALMHPEIRFSEYHIAHSVRYNGISKQKIWKTGFSHMFYILDLRIKYLYSSSLSLFSQISLFSKASILTKKTLTKLSI